MNLNNYLEEKLKSQNEIWRSQLIQLGTFDNLSENINIIATAIKNTLQNPRGRWILCKDHQDAHSEYSLTLAIDDKIQHIIIDRTFIDKGVRWIIDYKTTSNDNNLEQYRAQLATYAKAMSIIDNRPIRVGLYFPMLASWHELSLELN